MDRVIKQRLAIGRERDAPYQAIELSREQIGIFERRTFREPDSVNKLQQDAVPAVWAGLTVAGEGLLHVGGRCGGVDLRRRRGAAPAQPPEAVVIARDRELEARRIEGRDPHELALGKIGLAQSIELGAAEEPGDGGARERRRRPRRGEAHAHRIRRRLGRSGKGGDRFRLRAPHAARERQARERIQAEGAAGVGIVVRHLRAREQGGPGRGLRQVGLAQQPAASPGALQRGVPRDFRPDPRQGLEIPRRQILDLVAPRLDIQLEEALREQLERGFARGGAVAQRGVRPVDAQIRKPGQPRMLRVAHARALDRPVEREVPLGALPHGAGLRAQVRLEMPRRLERRAARRRGERARQNEPGQPHLTAPGAARRSISATIAVNCCSTMLRTATRPIKGGTSKLGSISPS